MPKKKRENNVETRMEDVKTQYDAVQTLIKYYTDRIEEESDPAYIKELKDFLKINITLRKQINDMEMMVQNGNIKTEKEESPFD